MRRCSLPSVWPKVTFARQSSEQSCLTSATINAFRDNVGTPPINVDRMILNSEEDDDARESDTCGKCCGKNIIVLLPPSSLVSPQIVHEAKGHVNCTREVCQVWCEYKQVQGSEDARGEFGLGRGLNIRAEHVLHERIELAEHTCRLIGSTDALDIIVHKVDTAISNQRSEYGTDQLTTIHSPGGLAIDVVSESLDKHQGLGAAGRSSRRDEDERNERNDEEPPIRHLFVVAHHLGEGIMKPIVDASLAVHEVNQVVKSLSDITAGKRRHGLPRSAAHVFELGPTSRGHTSVSLDERSPEIKDDEDKCESIEGEESAVHHKIASTIECWRVFIILVIVQSSINHDSCDIIRLASIVEDSRRIYRQVTAPLEVGVVGSEDDQSTYDPSHILLDLRKEWPGQRISIRGEHIVVQR
ncbi:OPT-domain-containing protein, partial [Aureobasidium melanogenum]